MLSVKSNELMTNIEGEQLSVKTIKDIVPHFNCIFMLMSFISAAVESIRKDEFYKKITGADDVKRDAAQRGTFS